MLRGNEIGKGCYFWYHPRATWKVHEVRCMKINKGGEIMRAVNDGSRKRDWEELERYFGYY